VILDQSWVASRVGLEDNVASTRDLRKFGRSFVAPGIIG
jgi:hypothetical protein